MTKPRKLTARRQAFVDAYTGPAMGNASEAARLAGYAHAGVEGHRLLKNAKIQQEIAKVSQPRQDAAIADRAERLQFYSMVMRDEAESTRDRARAAELLGKVQGDFIERKHIEHSGGAAVAFTITPQQARQLAAENDD